MLYRGLLDAFYLHLAFTAVGQEQEPLPPVIGPVPFSVIGARWQVSEITPPDAGFHEGFVRQIFIWFSSLEWFQGCSPGEVTDISYVELFLFWTVDTGCVPPFQVDGRWVRVGDDEDAICCIPSAYALFRTWRRAVSFVLRSRNLVPGVAVSAASSAVGLGAGFALPGLS